MNCVPGRGSASREQKLSSDYYEGMRIQTKIDVLP